MEVQSDIFKNFVKQIQIKFDNLENDNNIYNRILNIKQIYSIINEKILLVLKNVFIENQHKKLVKIMFDKINDMLFRVLSPKIFVGSFTCTVP